MAQHYSQKHGKFHRAPCETYQKHLNIFWKAFAHWQTEGGGAGRQPPALPLVTLLVSCIADFCSISAFLNFIATVTNAVPCLEGYEAAAGEVAYVISIAHIWVLDIHPALDSK